jgi:hypothetical protein
MEKKWLFEFLLKNPAMAAKKKAIINAFTLFLNCTKFCFHKSTFFYLYMRLYNMALLYMYVVYTLSAIWQIRIHPPLTPLTTISIRNYPNYAILPGITRFHTDKSWAPGVANQS